MTSTESEIHHAKEVAQCERSLRTLAEHAEWLDECRDQTAQAAASERQPDPIDQAQKVKTVADAGQSKQ
jgi:hypothetical protein